MSTDKEEFYVGYQPKAPQRLAKWLRTRALIPAVFVALAVGAFAGAQYRLSDASFAFGQTTNLTGYLVIDPYPALLVSNQSDASGKAVWQRVHLAGVGKHGATPDLNKFNNTMISIDGTLIQRDQESMLEVITDSVQIISDNPLSPPKLAASNARTIKLSGEIVDSKCHLGVMKPGEGIAHRACAIRCLHGGMPPLFVTGDADSPSRYILMTTANGELFDDRLMAFIGRSLTLTGELLQKNDAWFIQVDTDAMELL